LEEWRDITEYEGYYQVSSKGNVRSLDRTLINSVGVESSVKGKEIYKSLVGAGYYQVKLYKDGRKINKYVHQLVASAFISNPKNYSEINHIDYNKENNCVENLEWCTHIENIIDLRNKKYAGYKDSHNKLSTHKCKDCGKEISYRSTRCIACSNKLKKNRIRTRTTLYNSKNRTPLYKNKKPLSEEEVSESLTRNKGNFTKSAKEFNMTDNALRKWCRKYDLPTHSRDWMK